MYIALATYRLLKLLLHNAKPMNTAVIIII